MAVSLGTSDVSFGLMEARGGRERHRPSGCTHRCVHGIDRLQERVTGSRKGAQRFRNVVADFSRALSSTPAGNQARIFLPKYEPEITPSVQNPGCTATGWRSATAPAMCAA